jgi:hypothetical protein
VLLLLLVTLSSVNQLPKGIVNYKGHLGALSHDVINTLYDSHRVNFMRKSNRVWPKTPLFLRRK